MPSVSASVPARVMNWSLLKHSYEVLPGLSAELTPDHMDPGFWTKTGVRLDPGLQARVDALLSASPELTKVRFALVDLTKDRMTPRLAGNTNTAPGASGNMLTEQVFAASLAKIAAMYAAFQLQFDLESLVRERALKGAPLTTAARLASEMWVEWISTQEDKGPVENLPHDLQCRGKLMKRKGKLVPLSFRDWDEGCKNPRKDGSPNIEHMFDVAQMPGRVEFRRSGDDGAALHLSEDTEDKCLAHGFDYNWCTNYLKSQRTPFFERMLSMIDASENSAARSCILDVGYEYIASVLVQSDLFRPERGGGLWLSGTYVPLGPGWMPTPVPQIASNSSLKYQCSSPAAAAAFMTLLAQERLVSKSASAQMKFLMNKKKAYTNGMGWLARSFVGDGLNESLYGRAPDTGPYMLDEIYSKIGIGGRDPNTQYSDCAFVVHSKHGKRLSYVVSFVGLHQDDFGLLDVLIPGLDRCVLLENPGP